MPSINEVGKSSDKCGAEKLGPALGEAGKPLDTFGTEKLGPGLDIMAVALGQVGKARELMEEGVEEYKESDEHQEDQEDQVDGAKTRASNKVSLNGGSQDFEKA